MRPGDYMTINSSEVKLLESDAFREVAAPEILSKIQLTPPETGPEDYMCLALPKIGKPVAEALRALATDRAATAQAVVAEHLAERIEERIDHARQAR